MLCGYNSPYAPFFKNNGITGDKLYFPVWLPGRLLKQNFNPIKDSRVLWHPKTNNSIVA